MVVVLDNIRSAFNVGSVMRTCDALGAKLITVGYTPKPLGETKLLIKKTAINAEEYVEHEHFDLPQQVFETYPNKTHLGIELFNDAINIYDFIQDIEYNTNDLFVWLGNEIHGLNELDKTNFTYTLFLPMVGKKESLNVSNTTTAALYLLKMKDHIK
ncbi:MAG: TrmH family RNA methyltransferase [Patescibacteria group bacterium]